VAVASGGGEEAPPETTRPPAATTTTTTSTTTTTTLPPCSRDSAPPEVRFLAPGDNADVGARVDVEVEAVDPGPVSSGVREVRLWAEEQGGSRTAAIATFPGPGPRFAASWAVPACLGPQDRWYVYAEAVDGCERATTERVRVKRRSDSCGTVGGAGAAARGGEALVTWSSELLVPGGRGQLVVDGADVAFVGPGRSDLLRPARAGGLRVEAVLVDAAGGGEWRFTLPAGEGPSAIPRVLAGEAIRVGPGAAAFRLRGRPGERVVFSWDGP
jgi:hypothetical protein